jgi:phospholipid transport system substrate-binding protein
LSASDRAGVLEALGRYTEARYAYEFRDFDTQTIVIDPVVQSRGLDRLVRAEIRAAGEAPVKIGYRLREYAGAWRIIDVIYNGVSQLATQRADFAKSLQAGGAAALIRSLDQSTAKLK